MRRLAYLVVLLAACGKVTSTGTPSLFDDAGIHAGPRRDAPIIPPLDAYTPRACDAPATFADGLEPSYVLHVAAGAVGGDGSAARPFGSIAAAAAVATPGAFIKLGPGLHATNQLIVDLHGAPGLPIWIGGDDLQYRPIIDGGAEAIHLTRPSYVVIQNLEIRDQTSNGINIDDGPEHGGANHVLLSNVYVHDQGGATQVCVRAAGVTSLSIYDSQLTRCGGAVDLVGVHGAVVARNIIAGMISYGVQVRGGSTDVDVQQNRIRDAGSEAIRLGGTTPATWFRPPLSTTAANAEARRVRVFNNVSTGDTYAPFAWFGCVDCLVAHNFTQGEPVVLLRIMQRSAPPSGYTFEPTKDGRVINNTFTWNDGMLVSHVEVGFDVQATSFSFANNNWFAVDVPSLSTPALPVAETGSLIGIGTAYLPDAQHQLCGGPEVGAALPLPEITGTIEGTCRAEGDAPTIGPHISVLGGCNI
jgi:hypothetical protein